MSGKNSVKSESVVSHIGDSCVWDITHITVGELVKRGESGGVRVDMAYQRPEVTHWSKPEIVDSFIDSIIRGFPLPLIFVDGDGSILKLLDGKQRYTTLRRITSDMVIPLESWPIKGGRGESVLPSEIQGQPFSAWPKVYQDKFLSFPLLICNAEFSDDSDLLLEFQRLNKNGLPLTSAQAFRGKFADKLEALSGVLGDSVWEDLKINRVGAESILMQVCSGLYGSCDYSSKALVSWFAGWSMDSGAVVRVGQAVKRFSDLVAFANTQPDDSTGFKRFCKPLHIESFLHVVDSMSGFVAADAHLAIVQFFGLDKKSGCVDRVDYLDASSGSTASPTSVKARHDIMSRVLAGEIEIPAPAPKTAKTKTAKTESTGESADSPAPAPVNKWVSMIESELGKGVLVGDDLDKLVNWLGACAAWQDPKIVTRQDESGEAVYFVQTLPKIGKQVHEQRLESILK